jgi:IS30 family transposase
VKLQKIVASKLILDWSPEQVSGWLKIQYPEDESMRVSHETIYRSLFIQARGVLKKELLGHLRSKRRIRRSRHSRVRGQSHGQIADAISVRERPAEIEDRAIPGHWEGDLLSGTRNSHIVTLVERHSRFTALVKVPSKDTAVVVAALTRHVRKLPASLRCSLTWDRRLEMAKHKTFTVKSPKIHVSGNATYQALAGFRTYRGKLDPMSGKPPSQEFRLQSIKFRKLYKSEQYTPLTVPTLQSQRSKLEIPG